MAAIHAEEHNASHGAAIEPIAMRDEGCTSPRAQLDSAAGAVALEVFEAYPYGIVVATRDGKVLAHNAAAREVLGSLAGWLDNTDDGALSELLCWDVPAGSLENVCLLERAIDSGHALPEVRVDLPPGAGAPAVWVTAAPMRRGGNCAIVELRRGQANDRRRRTTPHWTQGPRLNIYALGRTRLESAEGPITGRWLENRAGQLLKYLVTERGNVVHPDQMVETLWPASGVRALPMLRYYIHELRERLEPEERGRGHSSFVVTAERGYRLDQTRVVIDADEFERHIATGIAAAENGDEDSALDHLARGMALYGGDFLADEPYAEWATLERDRLRAVAAEGLRRLADLRLRTGDLEAAAAELERLGALEPYDVDVHRQIIAVALGRGRRTDAMRRYNALRRRMVATFGEELEFTLSDISPA